MTHANAGLNLKFAHILHVFDFGIGFFVGQFVGGDSVAVQATSFSVGFKDNGFVTQTTQFGGSTLRAIAQGMRETIGELRQAVAGLPDTVATAGRATRRADAILATGQHDLETLMANLTAISQNLKELTDSAKRYPSQLLFGQPPRRSEP